MKNKFIEEYNDKMVEDAVFLTNEELKSKISDFGDGELLFETRDVERLLSECGELAKGLNLYITTNAIILESFRRTYSSIGGSEDTLNACLLESFRNVGFSKEECDMVLKLSLKSYRPLKKGSE